jgi:hypothetical protein
VESGGPDHCTPPTPTPDIEILQTEILGRIFIGQFSNNSLAMRVLVGPFFLLFTLITGISTGHGACTRRRAATSLSGS